MLKKRLVVALCCSMGFFANAQKDSVKTITIDLGKNYKYSLKPSESETTPFKIVATFLPVMGVIGAIAGVAYQIKARRKDDRLKNQLDRLNKQISEFYGPLYTLYETGDQNYYIYLKHCGKEVTFKNPHYRNWTCAVFQPTNAAMENIIINKADLILGKKIPSCLLQFCQWSATVKVYNEAEKHGNFDEDTWQRIINDIKHPELSMQIYLRACFEVLKEEQSTLLSGHRSYVDEEGLIEAIKYRAEVHKKSIKSETIINDKARDEIWKDAVSVLFPYSFNP